MSLQLELNDENEILSYLKFGGVEDVTLTEYNGPVPDNFEDDFKPLYFMLKDSEIVENPNYVAPKPPEVKPSDLEKQVATLGYQQMVDNQTIDALQQQNAQMAYQIMTGGK